MASPLLQVTKTAVVCCRFDAVSLGTTSLLDPGMQLESGGGNQGDHMEAKRHDETGQDMLEEHNTAEHRRREGEEEREDGGAGEKMEHEASEEARERGHDGAERDLHKVMEEAAVQDGGTECQERGEEEVDKARSDEEQAEEETVDAAVRSAQPAAEKDPAFAAAASVEVAAGGSILTIPETEVVADGGRSGSSMNTANNNASRASSPAAGPTCRRKKLESLSAGYPGTPMPSSAGTVSAQDKLRGEPKQLH